MISRRAMARHNRGRVSRGGGTRYWWPTADAPFAAYMPLPDDYTTQPEWGDDSGNGHILTCGSGSTDPAWNATSVNSQPGIGFSAGAELKALGDAASAWNFTVSGEMAIVAALQLDDTGSGVIFSTRNGGFNAGTSLVHESSVNKLTLYETNGAAVPLTLSATSINQPVYVPLIINVSRSTLTPHATMYINGSSVVTANYSAANGAGASKAMQFGYGADITGAAFTGKMGPVAFYDRPLTNAEIDAWWAKLATYASLRTQRVVRCLGDSITATYCYRRKLKQRSIRTTDQAMTYRGSFTSSYSQPLADTRHDGVAGETIAQIEARVASYSGTTITDVIVIAGTNDRAGTVGDAITAMGSLIDTVKSTHSSANVWICAIPYGTGGDPTATLAGFAGSYNAALPALCLSKGVNFVDIHSGSYAWVVGTDALDTTGHPTTSGEDKIGNTLAVALGFGGD